MSTGGQPATSAATSSGHGFGTLPVFLAAISTILGAVMFLRFGYAVGHLGLAGVILLILLGHMVTIPTAMAISEIATNLKVEGGGEYFFISRSFGPRIGSAIGLSLYLSQALSVGFYLIAFAEAFRPLTPLLAERGFDFDPRFVSLPATFLLLVLMLTKGAAMGVKALYVVVITLAVALLAFFIGGPAEGAPEGIDWTRRVDDPDAFFLVFAICFPAFTGMTAGVGLSGDLARPSRSIPLGTMAGTLVGMLVYVLIAWKLSVSAPPELLAEDQLVMSRIALWGPIIYIGLGAATLSSAIGSILVAPRTLQALARDGAFPGHRLNRLFAKGVGAANEPRVATIFTGLAAIVVVALGDVDFVARLISMFFMVTYGTLCAISFLEHFAASPSFRPTFRSRWYISLAGSVMCGLMMFQMDPLYALLALGAMWGFYGLTRYTPAGKGEADVADLLRGAMEQTTRWLHIQLQRLRRKRGASWRPRLIAVNDKTFSERGDALELMSWICERHGFGTYLHHVRGMLDATTVAEAERLQTLLIQKCRGYPGVSAAVLVSPSSRSALAQSLQLPGPSGTDTNTILFETDLEDVGGQMVEVVDDAVFAAVTGKDILILRGGQSHSIRARTIHVWLTWHDSANANLMLLLAYIILGHASWRKATVKVFAAFPSGVAQKRQEALERLLEEGRLPVSKQNVLVYRLDDGEHFRNAVTKESGNADLVIMGMTVDRLAERGVELLQRFPTFNQVLYVIAQEDVIIG